MQSGRDSPSSASTDTSITSLIATAQGPSTYTRAPKGKACLNCRKRKLKCDCAHPVCRQCARYNRGRDCEYTSKDQRSRTEILEETIANLRARIAELEHPDETQNHFNQYRQWQIGHDDRRTSSPAESHSTDSLNHEPSYPEAQALINAFLPHSAEVGFFLNPSRFLNWVYSQTSPTIRTPSSFSKQPAMILEEGNPLIWAAWVWGAAFTDDINLKSNGEIYLSKALDIVSAALRSLANGTLNPSSIVHIIQSEVLLANYFFYGSRFAEGRQHISAAVSLVLSYGLHKTGSQPVHDPSMMRSAPGSETEMALPPPIDTAEEGERICAFWQVYILDKTWANVLGKPSLINEIGSVQTFIDAPWPLPTEQYVEGPIPQDYGVEGRTLSRFLSEAPNFQTGPRLPLLALRAQAAALLDKASVLSSSSASGSFPLTEIVQTDPYTHFAPLIRFNHSCTEPDRYRAHGAPDQPLHPVPRLAPEVTVAAFRRATTTPRHNAKCRPPRRYAAIFQLVRGRHQKRNTRGELEQGDLGLDTGTTSCDS
ncbi:hypothetical protein BDW22DRAFT_1267464 [Trametopsis cervina]|nr:hypothetical protein BDW22DRAFT_1267464 [Trametopsis cervina]